MLIVAFPRTPFTGVNPWAGQEISGAQNLSGWSKFPPGHWALGLQKLPLLRSHSRAWVLLANGTGTIDGGSPKGLPYPILKDFLEARRAGTCPHRR